MAIFSYWYILYNTKNYLQILIETILTVSWEVYYFLHFTGEES